MLFQSIFQIGAICTISLYFLLSLSLRKFLTKIFATAWLSAILSHGHGLDHSVTNILVTLRCFLLIKVTRNVDINRRQPSEWRLLFSFLLQFFGVLVDFLFSANTSLLLTSKNNTALPFSWICYIKVDSLFDHTKILKKEKQKDLNVT